MAAKRSPTGGRYLDKSGLSIEELCEANKRLRTDLNVSRKSLQQLQRERTVAVKRAVEQEQRRASIALKDLKCKLHSEKARDMEHQKEALNRKFEGELGKFNKHKDSDIQKLRSDLKRYQDQLEEMTSQITSQKCGLSGMARGAFERDNTRLVQEVQELRSAKQQLEAQLATAMESDKQKTYLLKRAREKHNNHMARVRKEGQIEVKKLLAQLKCKDRHLAQAERERWHSLAPPWGKPPPQDPCLSPCPGDTSSSLGCSSPEPDLDPDSGLDSELSSLGPSLAESFTQEHQEPYPSCDEVQTSSLARLVEQLREQCSSLSHDKRDLEQKLGELEGRHRPLLDKTKKFLERNMELTNTVRQLEDQAKAHSRETTKLQKEIEQAGIRENDLKEKMEILEKNQSQKSDLGSEMQAIQELNQQQECTINALQIACADKDRRIELIAYRNRKDKQKRVQKKAAGSTETYYGYEEDASSVGTCSSLQRSSSHLSAGTGTSMEDDVFEEVLRDDCDRNYQLLVREHLVLERSYALLQTQNVQGSPWNPNTDMQMAALLEEKDKLNETVKQLREKVVEQERQATKLHSEFNESQETAEDLEFSLLEATEKSEELEAKVQQLEVTNKKLMEDARQSLTMTTPPSLSSDGTLQLYTEEKGIMEVKLSELKNGLISLKDRQVCHLNRNEQVLLVQAGAMLEAADKKLKDLQNQQTANQQRIGLLEEEKAELLSAATGVSADIVLEYEHARNQILQDRVNLESLQCELEALRTDNQHLHKQLALETHQHQLTESDKESSTLIHTLRKTEKEQMEQIESLQAELASQRKLIEEYETNESILTEKCLNLQDQIESLRERCSSLQDSLDAAREELAVFQGETPKPEGEQISTTNQLSTSKSDSDLDLFSDNQRLRSEVFSLREQLNVGAGELTPSKESTDQESKSQLKHLEKELADLSHDNRTLKEKLKEKSKLLQMKEEELMKSLRATMGMATEIASLRKDKARLTQSAGSGRDAEVSSLKQQIQDMETSNKVLKENLNMVTSQVKKTEEHAAQLKVQLAEQADQLEVSETNVGELVQEREHLQNQLDQLKADSGSVTQLQEKLLQLEETHKEQQTKLSELQDIDSRKSSDNEELKLTVKSLTITNQELQKQAEQLHDHDIRTSSDNEQLKAEVTSLTKTNQELQKQVELLHDLENQLHDLETQHAQPDAKDKKIEELEEKETALKNKVKDLTRAIKVIQEAEIKARDQLALVAEERARRIEVLQNHLDKMEDNEARLHETIAELEEVEGTLRDRLSEYESSSGEVTLDDIKEEGLELKRLQASEENLREQVQSLEEKLKNFKAGQGIEENDTPPDKSSGQAADVNAELEELRARESELLEQVYSMKLENQELQEHIDQLISDNESDSGTPRGDSKADVIEQLKEKLVQLESDNADLKDQLLRSKLDAIGTIREGDELGLTGDGENIKSLQDRINELEQSELHFKEDLAKTQAVVNELEAERDKLKSHQKEIEDELEQSESVLHGQIERLRKQAAELLDQREEWDNLEKGLREELQQSQSREKKLAEKLDILEQSEDKLMEQVDHLEGNEQKLLDQIEKLKRANEDHSRLDADHTEKIKALEKREEELQEQIAELEGRKLELKERLEQSRKSESKTIQQLQEKVDILLDTEERLIDRLQEQEEVEIDMKEKIQRLHEENSQLGNDNSQLQNDISRLNEKLASSDSVAQSTEHSSRDSDAEKIMVLEQNEKGLKERVNELEKSEAVLLAKLSAQSTSVEQMRESKESLRDTISNNIQNEAELKSRFSELEKVEILLRTRVSDLEAQNKDLLNALQNVQETTSQTHFHIAGQPTDDLIDSETLLQTIEEQIRATAGSAASPTRSMSPSGMSDTDFDGASKTAMLSRLRELEHMDKFHKAKIRELSGNLEKFREEVETVAVTIETDSDMPVQAYRSKLKDSEFEAKLMELVKSEVALRLKVLGLRKSEALLTMRLSETEAALEEEKESHHDELQHLEEDLHELRKSEARLRNEAEYGDYSSESAQLAKIQHLEDLVFDLEASERRLQHRVEELEDTETKYKRKFEDVKESSRGFRPAVIDLDNNNYAELLGQVKLLESSERDLKDQLVHLEKMDTSSLMQRIASLERSERGLKRQVDLLRREDLPSITEDPTGLDSVESILRRRILELESMERHLKKQIIELEHDREELHEIARKDKSTIHELTVSVRELQLSQKHLKEAANQAEARETELQVRLDEITDRNDDLENKLRQLQSVERQMKHQLQQLQISEKSLTRQLDDTQGDLSATRQRLQKRVNDLEQEKSTLMEKGEILSERLGEVEATETGLRQKLRDVESNQVAALHGKISAMERMSEASKLRIVELETLNENLQERFRGLEEDKSSLVYEVSDLETQHRDAKRENNTLQATVKALKDHLADHKGSATNLHQQLADMTAQQVELKCKLADAELRESEWRDRVTIIEKSDNKLRDRVHELEANIAATHSKMNSVDDVDKENVALRSQREHQQRALVIADERQHQLEEKLRLYEYSHTNKDMANLPRTELILLRSQVALLEEAQNNVSRLEKQERSLKDAINQLRQGKDACGHDAEIEDLKDRLDKQNALVQEREGLLYALNATKKAHELLKSNYAELKIQLQQSKRDGITVKSGVSNKSVQVRVTEAFTLKEVTPELKKALRDLGAQHPKAYEEFIRTLQPTDKSGLVVRASGGPTRVSLSPERSELVMEEGIVARMSRSFSAPDGIPQGRPDSDKSRLVRELVEYLPNSDLKPVHARMYSSEDESIASSLDELPVAGMSRRESHLFTYDTSEHVLSDGADTDPWSVEEEDIVPVNKGTQKDHKSRPIEGAKGQERDNLIGELVQRLPQNDPETLWHRIESHGGHQSRGLDNEHALWTRVERHNGEVDDVTLSFTVHDVDTDSQSDDSSGTLRKTTHTRSTLSLTSEASEFSVPPPLPTSLPPPLSYRRADSPGGESYYLPASTHEDSADDTSDLDDDRKHRGRSRARSAEPDSDFSEGTMSPLTRRRRNARSLESIPDDSGLGTLTHSVSEGLRERIAKLESQLTQRDNELAQAKDNLSDLHTKVKDSEDSHTLRNKLREREQQLEEEKVQTSQLTKQLKDTRFGQGSQLPNVDTSQLKYTLEKREKELQAKNNEIGRLSKELRQWQEDCRSVRDDLHRCQQQLKDAQKQVDNCKDLTNKHRQLRGAHDKLQKEHSAMCEREGALNKAAEDKAALEKIILKLRGQLNNLQHSELQKNDLQERLQAVEAELKRTKNNESELTRENASLLHHLDDMRKGHNKLQGIEKDFTRISSKYDEMERLKLKAQTLVTPLRARIIRISQKCQNKDQLIKKLGDALRRHGEPSDLVAEADRVTTTAASEEYNRPLSPLNLAFEDATSPSEAVSADSRQPKLPSRIPRRLRHSSGSSDDLEALLDTATNNGLDHPGKHIGNHTSTKHSTDSLTRSRSVEDLNQTSSPPDELVGRPSHLSRGPVTQLPKDSHQGSLPLGHSVKHPSSVLGSEPLVVNGSYRAIKDYEPMHFSRSGHQRLELPLREGDLVTVLGPVDDNGYHEAEVKGNIGLVPSNYLEPVTPTSSSIRHGRRRSAPRHPQGLHANSSPEQILDMYNQLHQTHKSSQPVHMPSTNQPSSPTHPALNPTTGLPPVSPRGSRPKSAPQQIAPHSGTHQLNGVQPKTGPSVGRSLPRLSVHPPRRTHGSLQSPPPTDRRQAVPRAKPLVEGPPAPPSDFHIQRVLGNHSVLLSWTCPHMDELARSNGATVLGYKVYINGRDKQMVASPHLCKALIEKLNLSRTYRFSIQTVAEGGQVSRMVDTLLDKASTDDGLSECDSAGDADVSSVLSSSQYEDGERRVFLAVYDYNPSEHSPQQFPGQELSFRTGDVITTYGTVRPDGFYHAKVHGRRGLVPASFIEEVAFLRSRSRRSISSSSAASQPLGYSGGSSSVSGERPSSARGNRPPSSLRTGPKLATAQV